MHELIAYEGGRWCGVGGAAGEACEPQMRPQNYNSWSHWLPVVCLANEMEFNLFIVRNHHEVPTTSSQFTLQENRILCQHNLVNSTSPCNCRRTWAGLLADGYPATARVAANPKGALKLSLIEIESADRIRVIFSGIKLIGVGGLPAIPT